ncbi:MAG: nickel pincer cofactor biosynthesis protein LarB [Deltaproteobacteria bacterium]|nr:nickel pincer cofactor biosynthesis protein LarB [Deltaproteobacteria bacterium]
MDPRKLAELLEAVRDGSLDVDEAMGKLRTMPFEDIGYARVDHHRSLRRGMPEVVYAPGKTDEQLLGIVERMVSSGAPVMVSRVEPRQAGILLDRHPEASHSETARIVTLGSVPEVSGGLVVVVTAGTADIPVAEEAALTASFAGARVEKIFDVGVAGLHRIVPSMDVLGRAAAIVAVAGMEGALPSVIAGMVACPVVAVPTSIGYGASFGGIAALLAMVNSCAGGVSVVNIDSGFNGGYVAALIARGAEKAG